jgi:integrase
MLLTDYANNDYRSINKARQRLQHLRGTFALDKTVHITSDRIASYVNMRKQSGAANATINRELAALKRAFNLALRAEKLSRVPHITFLEENNARQGFIEKAEFLQLREQLPQYLKDPISFLYRTGWRVSEMRSLEWRDVDLTAQVVRLRAENSKNNQPREVPYGFSAGLAEIIMRAQSNRRLNSRLVFHHRGGKPLSDFRKAWKAACTKAGLGKILVHDLRRSAVRNLVRAGVPERVAMELSGHRTRTVFERYNIVSPNDKQAALQKLATYLESEPALPVVVPLTQGQRS